MLLFGQRQIFANLTQERSIDIVQQDLDEKKGPKSLREYLGGIAESVQICRWMWQEFVTCDSRRLAKFVMALIALMAFSDLAQPYITKFVFDGLVAKDHDLVVKGLVGFAAGLLVSRFLGLLASRLQERLAGVLSCRVNDRTNELFFGKSLGQHAQEGSILNSASVDKGRTQAANIISMLLFDGTGTIASLSISFVLLWLLSPVAGGIMSLALLSWMGFTLYLNYLVLSVGGELENEFRRQNRERLERWDKIHRVATSGKSAEEINRLSVWLSKLNWRDYLLWTHFGNVVFFRNTINVIALTAVMSYGAWQVLHGHWTIGLLYPLYSWGNSLCQQAIRLGQIERQISANVLPVKTMIQALAIPPDIIDEPTALKLTAGEPIEIGFVGVSHSYPFKALDDKQESGEPARITRPVVEDFNLTISPGEKVALIGVSGAGKTTIMYLLLRFMDPDRGSVTINGHDLRDINLESWRQLVGYIPQQASILDGTLRYNLLFGLPEAEQVKVTDEELWRLMKLLQIDFGARLTDGLDTKVGRNGIKLSGGQAQRLAIGAAVIKKPKVMIIDEATSSLDPVTEKEVHDGLAAVLGDGITAFIITHRLSTVRDLCDRFVVLRSTGDLPADEPQVEAIGNSFEELYEHSSVFRGLADQAGLVIDQVEHGALS